MPKIFHGCIRKINFDAKSGFNLFLLWLDITIPASENSLSDRRDVATIGLLPKAIFDTSGYMHRGHFPPKSDWILLNLFRCSSQISSQFFRRSCRQFLPICMFSFFCHVFLNPLIVIRK